MKGAHMDEHSPYWQPPQTKARDFFAAVLRGCLFAAAVAMIVFSLPGCDDFDRRLAEQEFRQRVFNACVPEQGQRIVVVRDETAIHFTTIDLSAGRYGRKFPHTEIRVATIEEL
jgi:hypothetical protein